MVSLVGQRLPPVWHAGAEHGLAKGGEAEQREEQRVARAAEG